MLFNESMADFQFLSNTHDSAGQDYKHINIFKIKLIYYIFNFVNVLSKVYY